MEQMIQKIKCNNFFYLFSQGKTFFEGFLISRTPNSPITSLHHMYQGLTNIFELFGAFLGVTRLEIWKIFTKSSFSTFFIYKIMRNYICLNGTSTSRA